MLMATGTLFAVTLFLIGIAVGVILLQVYLSRQTSKWLGLILPALFLIFSLISVLSMAAFTTMGEVSVVVQDESGQIVGENYISDIEKKIDPGKNAAAVASVFLVSNIPTGVLLLIYWTCRQKQKMKNQLERMNVQDLE